MSKHIALISLVFTELSNHPKSIISRERNNSCVPTKEVRVFLQREKNADIVTKNLSVLRNGALEKDKATF